MKLSDIEDPVLRGKVAYLTEIDPDFKESFQVNEYEESDLIRILIEKASSCIIDSYSYLEDRDREILMDFVNKNINHTSPENLSDFIDAISDLSSLLLRELVVDLI